MSRWLNAQEMTARLQEMDESQLRRLAEDLWIRAQNVVSEHGRVNRVHGCGPNDVRRRDEAVMSLDAAITRALALPKPPPPSLESLIGAALRSGVAEQTVVASRPEPGLTDADYPRSLVGRCEQGHWAAHRNWVLHDATGARSACYRVLLLQTS